MGELATINRIPPSAPPPAPPPATSPLIQHAPWRSPGHADTATAAESLAMVATMAAQSRRAPKTRADYTCIYTRFVDWLTDQLGRPPQVADLTEIALLAWRNQRESSGGRGGHGLAASSLRTELAALRVLARKAGQPALALELALPRHTPPPPATISDNEYDRLLRMPDQRRTIGRRDAAILQLLGDAGLRSAELRGLRGGDLIRARRDSPRRSLRITRGKGGRGRTVRLTKAADEALDRWLAVQPLRLEARGAAAPMLPDAAPLFCILGRGRHTRTRHSHTGSLQIGRPLSADALERLVARHASRAGIPTAFGHPHVLRRYRLTCMADLGEPVHRLAAFAGHADIRVTQQYLAVGDPEAAEAIDRIDAHAAARARV